MATGSEYFVKEKSSFVNCQWCFLLKYFAQPPCLYFLKLAENSL